MKRKHPRKLVVYRTMGKLDYFEYWRDGVWKNEKQCKAWLDKHPNYEYGSIQVIRTSRAERLQEFYRNRRSEPQTLSEIVEGCKAMKQAERENKPVALKDEKDYTYNREAAEEWLALAKENNWDLNESIKPLCEKLGLAPVVIAPVLQRYGFIEKKAKAEKVYKYSKEQVQAWWDIKTQENLTIKQVAERVKVHFLQVGRAFTHYGYTPKKEKKEKVGRGRGRRKKSEE